MSLFKRFWDDFALAFRDLRNEILFYKTLLFISTIGNGPMEWTPHPLRYVHLGEEKKGRYSSPPHYGIIHVETIEN